MRADGSPHTTPVWFVTVGAALWIGSAAASVKVANLRHDPRVSLAVDGTGDRPYVAEGHAVVHDPAERPDVLARLAAKYGGWDAADDAAGHRVLIEVLVDRWLLRP